ncbi:hypothetical protein K3G39_19220 [Pontibacter sp. HSC-14F20]|uniref:hypothetical protein n=1 Tax=Pontibacter sp. HSC-14F20 TaxID=2864136 RepID=UPI001C7310A5|nr:hypothetical protein [Pontibacter sp. HSC-14F20]MBX0335372.1 hypothetical protein [Pontibacter sp. HSC-14F20]
MALSPAGAALLAEVGSLLETAAETRMGKAELLSLLRLLDECHLPAAEDRLAVQRYLLEHGPDKLSFSLTAADLSPTEHRPAPHTETATHS